LKTTYFLLVFLLLGLIQPAFATDPHEDGGHEEDPIEAMLHHIGDANEFHIAGPYSIPLPCIAWSDDGLMFTMSSKFEHGHKAYNGYVMHHGILMKVKGDDFPQGLVDVTGGHGESHSDHAADAHGGHQTVSEHGVTTAGGAEHMEDAKEHAPSVYITNSKGEKVAYELEPSKALKSTDSSWLDLSITKNVFGMLLGLIILLFLFSKISKAYTTRGTAAPKGVQSLMEPLIIFMRDEVVKPALGKDWQRFFPFIMCLFFFILAVNLLGLIPFFPGSANISGNIGFTVVMAVAVFLVVNFNGTKDYWVHVLWMPGVPTAIKPLMMVIEVVGLFMKPITLLIRLFANITAGHIIILSIVSLIFLFAKAGGVAGGVAGMGLAIPFVFALNLLELFVAFLQAFVFSLLAALYIGSALEEHDHHDHDTEHA
jgi:F-type H+-transporting ATPase subunit a